MVTSTWKSPQTGTRDVIVVIIIIIIIIITGVIRQSLSLSKAVEVRDF